MLYKFQIDWNINSKWQRPDTKCVNVKKLKIAKTVATIQNTEG